MTLDWKHYTIAALLLAVLASWGAREKTHRHQLDVLTVDKTTAETRATSAETRITAIEQQHKTEMSKAIEKTKKRTEIRRPDGSVIITEEELERSLETAKEEARQSVREEFQAKLDQAETVKNNLSHRINELEVTITKSAPRWAAALGYEPLSGQIRGGAGINIGPLTGLVSASPSLDLGQLRPQVEAILRF